MALFLIVHLYFFFYLDRFPFVTFKSETGINFFLGFRGVDFEPAPGSQSSKYIRFVNKLFSNVPIVIKKYMLSLTRAIIYLQGVSGFRSRPAPGSGSEPYSFSWTKILKDRQRKEAIEHKLGFSIYFMS